MEGLAVDALLGYLLLGEELGFGDEFLEVDVLLVVEEVVDGRAVEEGLDALLLLFADEATLEAWAGVGDELATLVSDGVVEAMLFLLVTLNGLLAVGKIGGEVLSLLRALVEVAGEFGSKVGDGQGCAELFRQQIELSELGVEF